MYPIYPLLCTLAAITVDTAAQLMGLCCRKCKEIIGSNRPSVVKPELEKCKNSSCKVLSFLVCILATPLGMSRVLASHRNYGGTQIF